MVRWGDFAARAGTPVRIDSGVTEKQVTVRVRHQGVQERRINPQRGQQIQTLNQIRIRSGQFIISKIDARNGACGFVPPDLDGAIVTQDFPVYDISDAEPSYLDHLVALPVFWRLCESVSDGTTNRVRLDLDQFDDLGFPLPPRIEQRAIAAVLDAAGETIKQTEAVIEATDELQEALLHDLLTRGVPGWHTEWKHAHGLGTIPACWEVVTLGECLMAIEAGRSPLCATRSTQDGEWGVLKVSAVSWGEFRPNENKALLPTVEPDPRYEIKTGDVLVSRANTPNLVGRAVRVRSTPRMLLLSDKTLRLIPNSSRITGDFLLLSLGTPASRSQISGAASGSSGSMYNVSQDALRQVRISLPNLTEQRRIADALDALAAMLQRANEELDEARAVKAALSDVLLSGRVRVKPITEVIA